MYFGIPLMQPAKSLVMMPASIVSMQTVSKFSQKRVSSGLSIKEIMSHKQQKIPYCQA